MLLKSISKSLKISSYLLWRATKRLKSQIVSTPAIRKPISEKIKSNEEKAATFRELIQNFSFLLNKRYFKLTRWNFIRTNSGRKHGNMGFLKLENWSQSFSMQYFKIFFQLLTQIIIITWTGFEFTCLINFIAINYVEYSKKNNI